MMAAKRFWFGILAIVLVFGMSLVGISCDTFDDLLSKYVDKKDDTPDGSSGGGTDTALNGTWIYSNGGYSTFSDGSFVTGESNGALSTKGTYTTNSDSITATVTHIHGSTFGYEYSSGDSDGNEFESRWYTKAEITASSDYASLSDHQKASLNSRFEPETFTYSVSGNQLILKIAGQQIILFKQKDDTPGSPDIDGTDPALLNGTWVYSGGVFFEFNNGSFYVGDNNGEMQFKGTYTASENSMILTRTHIHGDYLESLYTSENDDDVVDDGSSSMFESIWYTKAEVMTSPACASLNDNEKVQLNLLLSYMFEPYTLTYSVSGDQLVLTDGGQETIFFRQ